MVKKIESPLSQNEQKTLQIATILAIVAITILFFMQRIVLAMIVGLVLVILQKAYLSFKNKQKKK